MSPYFTVVGTVLPLVVGQYKHIWVYWVGPMGGSAIAALAYRLTADESEF